MDIKIGDKVRFLNDVGGGVVVGFNGASEVLVEHDSGFTIPFPRGECVVVASAEPTVESENSRRCADVELVVEQSPVNSKSPDRYNIYLAFVPQDLNNLGNCSVRVYLINDSEYKLFMNLAYLHEQDRYNSLKSTQVLANEILLVDELHASKLPLLENLSVHIIANKPFGTFAIKEPISKILNIRLVKFSKRGSFTSSVDLGCDAMVIDLTSSKISPKVEVDHTQLLIDHFKDTSLKQTTKKVTKQSSATPELVEIDLHIEKLLDSTAGMSNGDMLEYQLEHLRSVVAQYRNNRGLKVVFIHGKGDGVLRRSIIRELKHLGLGNRYQEASFKRYGYGALMVIM